MGNLEIFIRYSLRFSARATAARDVTLAATHDGGGQKMLIACGTLADYRCTWGLVEEDADGAVSLDADSARRIGLGIGDSFTMAGRA